MAWFHSASNSDLEQSIDLATQAAAHALRQGDRERAAGFQQDLAGMVAEENRREADKRGRRGKKN